MVLGPEMRSTGEVMGIDDGYGLAFAKAQAATGDALPKTGTVLFSLRKKDYEGVLPAARALESMGYRLAGTSGTAAHLKEKGLSVVPVKKIAAGYPNVLDLIKEKRVAFVVNTPAGSRALSDGFRIRRAALFHNVPLITTLSAAKAAVEGLQRSRERPWKIRSLQMLHS